MRRVGALIDPRARHPGRTARAHLLALAQSNGLPSSRVEEMIDLVGLDPVAHERVRGFSLGMGQRLGIAAALLGDPDVLVLDEPVNGLDPEGIRWVRELLRDLADEGRTVLVSSHLMSEMEDTADHLVVLGRGRLLADVPMDDLLGAHAAVRVRTPQGPLLAAALQRAGAGVALDVDGGLRVDGLDAAAVGDVAFATGVRVHELTRLTASLEAVYLDLTGDDVEYRSAAR
jgi:ABC-2 type transport system ATP-binding protein